MLSLLLEPEWCRISELTALGMSHALADYGVIRNGTLFICLIISRIACRFYVLQPCSIYDQQVILWTLNNPSFSTRPVLAVCYVSICVVRHYNCLMIAVKSHLSIETVDGKR